ncbi:MAG: hypothetical protein JNK04_12995 [Myxococcales bacterium]|nr:hypothetical protein [Myxococcales bacterium]
MTRRLGSSLLIATVALASTPALGEEPISVRVDGCTLRSSELERLVKLELASVLDAGAAGGYVVAIRCEADEVQIALRDPLTKKGLERTVVAPPSSQPEPERLLALTIAQLYRASWLELAAEPTAPLDSPPTVERPVAELAKAREAAVGSLPVRVPPPSAVRPSFASLGVSVGGRVRASDAPVLLPSLDLRASWLPTGELVWLSLATAAEWANVTRASGSLSALVLRGDLGVGIEPLVSGPWSGFAEVEGGIAVTRIAGDAEPGYWEDTALGPGFEGSLGLGAAARVDAIRFELLARVGFLHGTPAGIVSDDADLSLDGVSGGLDLRVRWML